MTDLDTSAQREEFLRRSLAAFIRARRMATPRSALPDSGAPSRSASTTWATLEQVADKIGMTPGWLAKIEHGRPGSRLDRKYVEPLCQALRLRQEDRNLLYGLSQGFLPAPTLQVMEVQVETQAVLDAFPYPAYVSDPAWTIIAGNRLLREWLPPLIDGANVMVQAMCNPVMRQRLHCWAEAWARPMLGQLTCARFQVGEPYAERLALVESHIRRHSPQARAVWDRWPHTVYVHPDGEVRPLMIPGEGIRWVRLAAMELDGYPFSRMMVLMPAAEPSVWPPVLPDEAE